jgi:hypothetical protein
MLPCGGRGIRQYAAFTPHDTAESVQLAPKHNRDIRIGSYTVEEKQHAKGTAKSSYLPPHEATPGFWHLTDTQLIEIDAGSFRSGRNRSADVSTVLSLPTWTQYLGVFRLKVRFTPAIS